MAQRTPPRVPLGELPLNVRRPDELDAICEEALGLEDEAQPLDASTPPGLSLLNAGGGATPPPSRRDSWSQAQRDRENERRSELRASRPQAERERRRREYSLYEQTPEAREAARDRAQAQRERQREHAARERGAGGLYDEADRLLEHQHRCSGAPISANSMRVAGLALMKRFLG